MSTFVKELGDRLCRHSCSAVCVCLERSTGDSALRADGVGDVA